MQRPTEPGGKKSPYFVDMNFILCPEPISKATARSVFPLGFFTISGRLNRSGQFLRTERQHCRAIMLRMLWDNSPWVVLHIFYVYQHQRSPNNLCSQQKTWGKDQTTLEMHTYPLKPNQVQKNIVFPSSFQVAVSSACTNNHNLLHFCSVIWM